MKWNLDSPAGHIACTFVIFVLGGVLYVFGYEYGKEIMAGALGSLWTLLQVSRSTNIHPEVVNQAETITVAAAGDKHSSSDTK